VLANLDAVRRKLLGIKALAALGRRDLGDDVDLEGLAWMRGEFFQM